MGKLNQLQAILQIIPEKLQTSQAGVFSSFKPERQIEMFVSKEIRRKKNLAGKTSLRTFFFLHPHLMQFLFFSLL